MTERDVRSLCNQIARHLHINLSGMGGKGMGPPLGGGLLAIVCLRVGMNWPVRRLAMPQ